MRVFAHVEREPSFASSSIGRTVPEEDEPGRSPRGYEELFVRKWEKWRAMYPAPSLFSIARAWWFELTDSDSCMESWTELFSAIALPYCSWRIWFCFFTVSGARLAGVLCTGKAEHAYLWCYGGSYAAFVIDFWDTLPQYTATCVPRRPFLGKVKWCFAQVKAVLIML